MLKSAYARRHSKPGRTKGSHSRISAEDLRSSSAVLGGCGLRPAGWRFPGASRLLERDCPAAPRRAMVQARQIYVYSAAAKDGAFREGGELADSRDAQPFRSLTSTARTPRRASPSRSTRPGNRHSQFRDSYTHAFILLSLASLYELTGEKALLSAAEATLGFIDRHLVCPDHGGMLDGSPSAESVKRQNPAHASSGGPPRAARGGAGGTVSGASAGRAAPLRGPHVPAGGRRAAGGFRRRLVPRPYYRRLFRAGPSL